MKTTFIYVLIDPTTNLVRYVGKSNNLNKRLEGHLGDKRNTHKANWIRSLKNKGLKPIIEEVDCVSMLEWEFWECFYMDLYKSWGFQLTNYRSGGSGIGTHSELSKLKMRTSPRKVWKFSEKHLEFLRTRWLGKNNPNFGKEISPSRRQKLKEVNTKTIIVNCIACNKIIKTQPAKKRKYCSHKCSQKMARVRCVDQYSLSDEYIKTWDSIAEVVKNLKINSSNISACCSGKIKSYKNYKWKYNVSLHN